jgi:predicted nicotinamide N-methyase
LGAGTALPGIVAAKVGALVILTDSDDQPHVYVLTYAAA